jgi:hypothetical protein
VKLRNAPFFAPNSVSSGFVPPSFLFPERLHCCYIYFHCSYNYYNNLEPCALNASFSISYPDLMKLPYFADLIQRGDGGEKRPKDRVKTGKL